MLITVCRTARRMLVSLLSAACRSLSLPIRLRSLQTHGGDVTVIRSPIRAVGDEANHAVSASGWPARTSSSG